MKVGAVLGLLLILPILSGCNILGFKRWAWHQKLTVVVQTPNGDVSGSSVGSVTVFRYPTWWGLGGEMGREKPNFKGEAVAVQVAPGKYLFAVLDGYGFKTAWNAYLPATNKPRSRAEVGEYYSALQGAGETRVLQPDQYPLLVTFQDAGDPASLKRVVPGAINAVFGPGYYLKSIEFSITDEADD